MNYEGGRGSRNLRYVLAVGCLLLGGLYFDKTVLGPQPPSNAPGNFNVYPSNDGAVSAESVITSAPDGPSAPPAGLHWNVAAAEVFDTGKLAPLFQSSEDISGSGSSLDAEGPQNTDAHNASNGYTPDGISFNNNQVTFSVKPNSTGDTIDGYTVPYISGAINSATGSHASTGVAWNPSLGRVVIQTVATMPTSEWGALWFVTNPSKTDSEGSWPPEVDENETFTPNIPQSHIEVSDPNEHSKLDNPEWDNQGTFDAGMPHTWTIEFNPDGHNSQPQINEWIDGQPDGTFNDASQLMSPQSDGNPVFDRYWYFIANLAVFKSSPPTLPVTMSLHSFAVYTQSDAKPGIVLGGGIAPGTSVSS
jgi:hypothetical protein